jgi:hypothetical protein
MACVPNMACPRYGPKYPRISAAYVLMDITTPLSYYGSEPSSIAKTPKIMKELQDDGPYER